MVGLPSRVVRSEVGGERGDVGLAHQHAVEAVRDAQCEPVRVVARRLLDGVLRREGQGFMETDAADSSIALCAAVVDAAPAEDEEDVQGDADGDFEREVELDLDEDAISEVLTQRE